MKFSFARQTAAFFTAIALTACSADLQAASSIKPAGSNYPGGSVLVYERSLNPYIGISAGNANGTSYTITDSNGKVVMTGSIRSDKTFYITTGKLATGMYCFRIGGQVMQQFIIR